MKSIPESYHAVTPQLWGRATHKEDLTPAEAQKRAEAFVKQMAANQR